MGQYMAVGITFQIYVQLERVPKVPFPKGTLAEALAKLTRYDLALFDLMESDDAAGAAFALKRDILYSGLVPALEDFYSAFRREYSEHDATVLKELRRTHPEGWLDLARQGKLYSFQYDRPMRDSYSLDLPFRPKAVLQSENLRLSAEGKVVAECWREHFAFVQHCMRRCFAQHRLAGALTMYLSG